MAVAVAKVLAVDGWVPVAVPAVHLVVLGSLHAAVPVVASCKGANCEITAVNLVFQVLQEVHEILPAEVRQRTLHEVQKALRQELREEDHAFLLDAAVPAALSSLVVVGLSSSLVLMAGSLESVAYSFPSQVLAQVLAQVLLVLQVYR